MYLINDVWVYIKTFLFHNIKIHGKHLKNDIHVKNYNNSVKVFNTIIKKPFLGPKIIHLKERRNYKLFKFIYEIKYKNIRKLIIEYKNVRMTSSPCGRWKEVLSKDIQNAYDMGVYRKLN
tara:strand:- start:3462 stop:3821 length:360 start_codon:yes stop_codon:yes gene_type:complete